MSLDAVAQFQEERGKSISKYIKLKDGETFVGVYLDVVNAESNKFREPDGSPTINSCFTFKIGTEEKKFNLRAASKGTRGLVEQMRAQQVKPGDTIAITRVGSGTTTLYRIGVDKPETDVPNQIDTIFKK